MSQKFNHRQRMERLAIRQRFEPNPKFERMLEAEARQPDFAQTLPPTERVSLARYKENKETAGEVEQDLKRMGSSYYDLHE